MVIAVTKRARVMSQMRLHSATQTALVCMLIGCTTLLSPPSLTKQLAFPAFSYVTAILIVPDATLGKVLRGSWYACYATIQAMPLSMLGLWIHGSATTSNISPLVAAVMVAISAFLVALPESTSLMSKRIAFGQLVIVYVDAVVHGIHVNIFMHPLRVASSTALGSVASFLALLLPYPWLAYFELRKLYSMYAENASERINLYIEAVHTRDVQISLDLLSQAKPISETGCKILESIKLLEESLQWEKPWLRLLSRYSKDPGRGLHDIEHPMKGMEIALTAASPCLLSRMVDEELMSVSHRVLLLLRLKMEQARCFFPSHSMIAPEAEGEYEKQFSSSPPEPIFPTNLDQPALFFLSCVKMCINDLTMNKPITKGSKDSQGSDGTSSKRACSNWIRPINIKTLVFACKCSISLGLAVLLGLLFDRENGYWSGLTIAISFETGKLAIFTVANARAQGTALGSVYGILGCAVFEGVAELRFLALIPWIVFTSFLRHSKMYSRAGGDAAVIGALLILGRKGYGSPREFAIARLTEAFIGLSCFIILELLLQPTRAATLAKNQLYLCLGTLKDCTKQIVLDSRQNGFIEKQTHLNSQVKDLQKFITDAELEPDFWYTPFPISCYQKVHKSLSNVVHLLYFMAYSTESLSQAFDSFDADIEEIKEHITRDIELLEEALSSSISCIEKTISARLLGAFQDQPEERKIFYDLEEGKSPQKYVNSSKSDKEQEILSSFIEHSKEVTDKTTSIEGREELKRNMVIHLCSIGFCMSCLMREVKEIEKGIKDMVSWEDPLDHPVH